MNTLQTRASTHYKIIASNQISIHVVEDPTIYRLDLTSSVGELITSDVDSITITAILTGDRKDITNQCSNIVWRKYIYDLNVPVLDNTWGAEFEGLDEIVLTSEEIFTKCKIECEAYLAGNDGQDHRVAGHYLTLVDVVDLRPSLVEPSNPKDGDLWLDINFNPPILKVYLDGKWVELNSQIQDIEELLKKLESLDDRVNDLRLEIDENGLLSINNKTDYLFDYYDSLSSTNGESPINNYKKNILKDSMGKFRNCAFIDILEGNELLYNKKIIDTKNDFTINIHLKPGNQLIARDTYRIISTGEDVASSLLTLWSYYPNTTDPQGQNRRLCLEFGNDSNGVRQTLTLSYPNKLSDWSMVTISYEASKKEFAVYLNGEIWGLKTVDKINPIEHFGFKRSGWYYENLVVLKKLLTPSEIKSIYNKNKPFKDYSPLITTAPTPKIIEFNANVASEIINTNVLINNMKMPGEEIRPGDMFFEQI